MIYTDPKFLDVIRALDELLVSENPTVRELIQQAILVQTMENPERDNGKNIPTGPFEQMFHQMQLLRAEVNALKHGSSYWHQTTYSSPYTNTYNTPGAYTQATPTLTLGNIMLDNMQGTMNTISSGTYTTDLLNDYEIDWNKYFSNIKTEADASDPKPAEDYYDPAKEEVAATSAKLKEILDKLK
jgi:hypothetical protein